ncbi:hypothetical protein EVG20_g2398 [Dentipellis fragilis]|uniref:Uncharacterized protein n=1 Tax=Dentipellis fragilis TaxID=205917 RepID=A0A4Y9ZB50_9AGAM|nr:hypothetical protein EVG20_g2398 [Dentipellis fragilis]
MIPGRACRRRVRRTRYVLIHRRLEGIRRVRRPIFRPLRAIRRDRKGQSTKASIFSIKHLRNIAFTISSTYAKATPLNASEVECDMHPSVHFLVLAAPLSHRAAPAQLRLRANAPRSIEPRCRRGPGSAWRHGCGEASRTSGECTYRHRLARYDSTHSLKLEVPAHEHKPLTCIFDDAVASFTAQSLIVVGWTALCIYVLGVSRGRRHKSLWAVLAIQFGPLAPTIPYGFCKIMKILLLLIRNSCQTQSTNAMDHGMGSGIEDSISQHGHLKDMDASDIGMSS